jgi:hypothetical protein
MNASCTVTPNQVDLSGGTAQAFTVSVNTHSPGTHSSLLPPGLFQNGAMLACLIPGLLFALGGPKKSLRSFGGLPRSGLFLLLVVFTLLHSGCGGGSSSMTSPPPTTSSFTPAGTYTVTVTATQNTVIRSINLTLVVQ